MNKVFKNIKNGKLYILVELNPKVYTALPLNSDGGVISNCDMIDFVPVVDSSESKAV